MITACALLVSALSLLPLLFVAGEVADTGWATAIEMLWRPRVGELMLNTLSLALVSIPLATVLSVAMAWLTERTNLPGRHLWAFLGAAPLAIPAFVHSYAWVSVVPSMHGLWGAVLVSVLAYYPFLYLPIAATLRRLDPGLEDVAASLGLTPARIFFRVVLPQLRLAMLGGGLLVGLHLLAEFGLYALIRFDTFTTAIYDQFQSTYNGRAAHMLAGVLVLCCFLLLALEAALRGRARYAHLGAGAMRMPQMFRLSPPAMAAALVLPLATAALALGVPLVTLARWLVKGGPAVWQFGDIGPALAQTLLFAAAGALLTTCAAIPVAWLSVRAPGRLPRLLEGVNYVASAMPGIVVALALVTLTIRYAQPIYQTVVTAVLAYLLMFLPRALVSVRAGIAQVPVELEDAARSLGRSPLQALWAITIRLAAAGAAAGAALVFLGIANELTATLLLAPNGTRTLATGFWMWTSELDYAAAAPYALIMIVLSSPLTLILHHQSRRMAGR